MILFNVPGVTGKEQEYIQRVVENRRFSGDGEFTKLSSQWMASKFDTIKTLLTTSCTHALEMAAILADIKEGDEVILPSYTFVSTANAFALRGANIVFVDIRPDTMNIDETLIEAAITTRTKAIVPVHYAGVSCEMDTIMEIAKKYNLLVIEDAAQGVMSRYKGRYLGSIGHLGCYSFHETKNYNCGEGGALLVNDSSFVERAEIIREKGTDRSLFFRGQVDKYTWVDIGSSYLPSEINAAFLYAQLQMADVINDSRKESWTKYYTGLEQLQQEELIKLPFIPVECEHNAHMFYIKCKSLEERTRLIQFLKSKEIQSVFHYIPLHSSAGGLQFGRFHGVDKFTTSESDKILRLPMYYNIDDNNIGKVIEAIYNFYH
ncbi:dTDP-4-amino-4,6-dideoxygalactose transaminase [Paenibacillus sp. BGI2013]|uniref:dTDP-4-amino-4,6-dideoxygalactose transaminase n=1 Tax=Paenibacillus TaxID=44249 RepID=UPI00096E623C|nr:MULTISPECIES: dTDP-4-amino-4,6-dideoxygalactose transaminase [Paenibacillus]OMF39719.1 dTDP-4-amino-4,6-dideoxygalactose transaminase [Paenibacillus amylolyticus]PKQ92478.1 dTDP-4-amino-4,6-dideoxygalactose transaminase [Paenibacillus sp. BGI2013]